MEVKAEAASLRSQYSRLLNPKPSGLGSKSLFSVLADEIMDGCTCYALQKDQTTEIWEDLDTMSVSAEKLFSIESCFSVLCRAL